MSAQLRSVEASFLTLPGSLPFDSSDYSDFDNLLTVPQHGTDFSLSSASSLDATDLFLPDLGFDNSSESTSSFSSPSATATSRLEELTADFPITLESLSRRDEQTPAAAPLPLGTHGLKLKLDCNSVLSAWHCVGGGAHPFQLRGPQLTAAVCTLPSTADLAASISAASMPSLGGQALPASRAAGAAAAPAPAAGSAAAPAAAVPAGGQRDQGEEARRKDAVSRYREKKSNRKGGERKVMYTARKVNADKRPRIKGRFVTKQEYDEIMGQAQNATGVDDRAVPTATLCA